MKPRLVLLIPLLLILAACAANGTGAPQAPQPSPKPGYASMYYFSTGALDMHNGAYNTALVRFSKAAESDPGSSAIRKHLILSAILLHSEGGTEAKTVKEVLASQRQYIAVDEETLEAVHGFYNEVADTTGLLQTISAWQDKYPGPRPYILRYVYEFKFRDIADPQWLYSALDMAWNDPEDLGVLGRLLMLLEDPLALKALTRLHDIAPDPEGDDMLVRQLFSSPDSLAVSDFFAQLSYPDHRELMIYIAEWALSLNHLVFFASAQDDILATGDPDIIEFLSGYALFGNHIPVLQKILPLAQSYDADPPSEARIILSSAALALQNRMYEPLPRLLDKLSATADFDLFPEYYKEAWASTRTDTTATEWNAISPSFEAHLLNALPASPIRDHLLWYCGPLEDSLHALLYTERKAALIVDLMQKGRSTAADIEYLAQYFGTKDRPQDRIALLKKGVELFPDNTELLNNLGYSMLLSGMDADEAATYINRALALEPGNAFYLDSLAWYHYLQGNYSEALELMQIPLQMEELPSEIAYHAGLIYMRLNDFEKARAMLQEAIRIGNDPIYVEKSTRALEAWGF